MNLYFRKCCNSVILLWRATRWRGIIRKKVYITTVSSMMMQCTQVVRAAMGVAYTKWMYVCVAGVLVLLRSSLVQFIARLVSMDPVYSV